MGLPFFYCVFVCFFLLFSMGFAAWNKTDWLIDWLSPFTRISSLNRYQAWPLTSCSWNGIGNYLSHTGNKIKLSMIFYSQFICISYDYDYDYKVFTKYLTCNQKLTDSQISLPHGLRNKPMSIIIQKSSHTFQKTIHTDGQETMLTSWSLFSTDQR